jgi:hypothetical protein
VFSAYLTVYNDWEFLLPALQSIAPYVDELVVVDGAYEWLAPYLSAFGQDVTRSDRRVYEAIEESGIPFRVISQVWANQIEKRAAGYAACTRRHVMRIDADEIVHFDARQLESFMSRQAAVGKMEMPTYVAPGWISAPHPAGSSLPCQCILFDSRQISPEIHLNYLWLVRDVDKLPRSGEFPRDVYSAPIGFIAHLTIWRAPPGSVYRAESYVVHHMLQHGVGWLPQLRGKPLGNISQLLDVVPAGSVRNIVECTRLSFANMVKNQVALMPTPLKREQENAFSGLYLPLFEGHAALNRRMTKQSQVFASGTKLSIDVTDQHCTDAITSNDTIEFEFDCDVAAANAEVRSLIATAPWIATAPLELTKGKQSVAVHLPKPASGGSPVLRREIGLRVRPLRGKPLQSFKIASGLARP